MNHGHNHAGMMRAHSHEEKNMREYRNYWYLFVVSVVSATAEFLIALLLAHSVSAQADAIHALTHLALYALALFVSRQIYIRHMDMRAAYQYRDKFIVFYAAFVFVGLAWISYMSIAKLRSFDSVVSHYMLLSVSIGLCGNIIALKLLHAISKIHGEIAHAHRTHQWISLDTWVDFAFSVIVLVTSIAGILFPTLPIRGIDSIISLAAVIWIGTSGIAIMRGKTI